MNSNRYDIVLMPSPELAEKAIKLSEELERFDSIFTLKDGSYYPHASLFMTQLKEDDLEKVKSSLESIALGSSAVHAEASKFNQSDGYISVSYHRTAELDELQQRVLNAINPMRDGFRQKDMERLERAEGVERANLEQYGYQSVGELFDPHITFTRLNSSEPVTADNLVDVSEYDGDFTKLGLFELGDHGTCVRKIAEFALGKL